MQLENSFEVAASRETAWKLLMDVPRVVPCMPGAELTRRSTTRTGRRRSR
jgi:carbon monoxide dehydrogenase subunit G